MKKNFLTLFLFVAFTTTFAQQGGMWIPMLLEKNEAEMQAKGFQLTAEDVYSVNNSSIKDAVVFFGRGCTGEIISPNGLILTNHHCGYSYVARYSTVENNYLHNGFWAKNYEEEIPCTGLTVTFLERMEDVTEEVLSGVKKIKNPETKEGLQARADLIEENIAKVIEKANKGNDYHIYIKPFYYGNQYFMFVNTVYSDVRMVGVPPENIGKFGGDTDNWMWPRHTGDFSLYRVYTDKEGKPAPYSTDNIPMQSKKHFPISGKGASEDDFTMVMGYPGTTMQYLLSDGVDLVVNYRNPPAIHQRGKRLDVMKKYMKLSTENRLKYSTPAHTISKGLKQRIGENKGVAASRVIAKKQAFEKEIQAKIEANPEWKAKYGTIIQDIKNDYKIYRDLETQSVFLRETFNGLALGNLLKEVQKTLYPNGDAKAAEHWPLKQNQLRNIGETFYAKNLMAVDREIFIELVYYFFNELDPKLIPASMQQYAGISMEKTVEMADVLYNFIFMDMKNYESAVVKISGEMITKLEYYLEGYKIFNDATEAQLALIEPIKEIKLKLDNNYRIYLEMLMQVAPERVRFPDANLTLRVAYGNVEGIEPLDGIAYLPFTTVTGILEKENPEIFDYKVDPTLKQLILNKDFGNYANEEGNLHVAFIASNHTTGGNSGSPILNAKGELIGVNFDRMWEGTMSDLYYDIERCRNISLDSRYILFIIDKYANAQNIIDELDIRY